MSEERELPRSYVVWREQQERGKERAIRVQQLLVSPGPPPPVAPLRARPPPRSGTRVSAEERPVNAPCVCRNGHRRREGAGRA